MKSRTKKELIEEFLKKMTNLGFVSNLTGLIFFDPINLKKSTEVFERQFIEECALKTGKNPITREPLNLNDVQKIPSLVKIHDQIEDEIKDFLEQNKNHPEIKEIEKAIKAERYVNRAITISQAQPHPAQPTNPTADDLLAMGINPQQHPISLLSITTELLNFIPNSERSNLLNICSQHIDGRQWAYINMRDFQQYTNLYQLVPDQFPQLKAAMLHVISELSVYPGTMHAYFLNGNTDLKLATLGAAIAIGTRLNNNALQTLALDIVSGLYLKTQMQALLNGLASFSMGINPNQAAAPAMGQGPGLFQPPQQQQQAPGLFQPPQQQQQAPWRLADSWDIDNQASEINRYRVYNNRNAVHIWAVGLIGYTDGTFGIKLTTGHHIPGLNGVLNLAYDFTDSQYLMQVLINRGFNDHTAHVIRVPNANNANNANRDNVFEMRGTLQEIIQVLPELLNCVGDLEGQNSINTIRDQIINSFQQLTPAPAPGPGTGTH